MWNINILVSRKSYKFSHIIATFINAQTIGSISNNLLLCWLSLVVFRNPKMIVERYAPFIRKIISLWFLFAGMFIKDWNLLKPACFTRWCVCSFSLCGMVFTLDTTLLLWIYSGWTWKKDVSFEILFLLSGARWSYYVKTNIWVLLAWERFFKNPAIQGGIWVL